MLNVCTYGLPRIDRKGRVTIRVGEIETRKVDRIKLAHLDIVLKIAGVLLNQYDSAR